MKTAKASKNREPKAVCDNSPKPEGNQPEGRYANYFKIGFNAFEFLLDFIQYYPENKQSQAHTRIITSPAYANRLLETLKKSIDQYQEAFGAIEKDSSKRDHIRRKT